MNVATAIIADNLGLQERTVIMIQRKLGLRKCVPNYVQKDQRRYE